jgi:hypothetical protein
MQSFAFPLRRHGGLLFPQSVSSAFCFYSIASISAHAFQQPAFSEGLAIGTFVPFGRFLRGNPPLEQTFRQNAQADLVEPSVPEIS